MRVPVQQFDEDISWINMFKETSTIAARCLQQESCFSGRCTAHEDDPQEMRGPVVNQLAVTWRGEVPGRPLEGRVSELREDLPVCAQFTCSLVLPLVHSAL